MKTIALLALSVVALAVSAGGLAAQKRTKVRADGTYQRVSAKFLPIGVYRQ